MKSTFNPKPEITAKKSKEQQLKWQGLYNNLEKYGEIAMLEESEGRFYVRITKGFSNKVNNVLACQKEILDVVGGSYSIIHLFKVDDNDFHLVLKPKILNALEFAQRECGASYDAETLFANLPSDDVMVLMDNYAEYKKNVWLGR